MPDDESEPKRVRRVQVLGDSTWDPVNGLVARDYVNDTVTMDSTVGPWWPRWVDDALGAIEGET